MDSNKKVNTILILSIILIAVAICMKSNNIIAVNNNEGLLFANNVPVGVTSNGKVIFPEKYSEKPKHKEMPKPTLSPSVKNDIKGHTNVHIKKNGVK